MRSVVLGDTSTTTSQAITVQAASRRSGLSEPTLRYSEEVGLIGPIARDPGSGHRRYGEHDLRPRGADADADATIIEAAESLRDLGLLTA